MTVSISKEDREILEDLFNSLVSFKQTLLQLSLIGLKELKKLLINFIISLGDFSPSEIQKYGLEEILYRRAMNFFGLADSAENEEKKIEKKKVTSKSIVKRIIGVVLLPLYLLIIIVLYFRHRKINKDVKNNLRT